MDPKPIRVVVVAVSAGSCAGKQTWETATALLRTRLDRHFRDAVSVEYIEFLSQRSLELPSVLEDVGNETLRLPVVLVNDQVLSSGTKINEGVIARRVAELLKSAS